MTTLLNKFDHLCSTETNGPKRYDKLMIFKKHFTALLLQQAFSIAEKHSENI